jgi:hypothetical protein
MEIAKYLLQEKVYINSDKIVYDKYKLTLSFTVFEAIGKKETTMSEFLSFVYHFNLDSLRVCFSNCYF